MVKAEDDIRLKDIEKKGAEVHKNGQWIEKKIRSAAAAEQKKIWQLRFTIQAVFKQRKSKRFDMNNSKTLNAIISKLHFQVVLPRYLKNRLRYQL